MSMACMLPALGAKRVLVEDDDALAQINNRMVKRDSRAAMHAVAVHYQLSRRFLRRIARKGGLNSRKNLDPETRTELARNPQRRGGQRSSDNECDQFNGSNPEDQYCKRYRIVFQPNTHDIHLSPNCV